MALGLRHWAWLGKDSKLQGMGTGPGHEENRACKAQGSSHAKCVASASYRGSSFMKHPGYGRGLFDNMGVSLDRTSSFGCRKAFTVLSLSLQAIVFKGRPRRQLHLEPVFKVLHLLLHERHEDLKQCTSNGGEDWDRQRKRLYFVGDVAKG